MSARTADKYITMLRPLWDWAIFERRVTAASYKANPWDFGRSVPRGKKSDKPEREAFKADDCRQPLKATQRGTRGGDAFRLSLATGV
ncbi:hypothetical protein SAMN05421539_104143 [Jannaschia seohaensis]|uniref:Uncharacterized protein n=1 Tax=Jannaschia seohaensis TaxID=475081 RepID=A0A2Y9C7K1_9RHOB|nr:hypothetical protein BCF38_104143 [Jannaschia seohaensis]SSA45873.1 hypothetical protein SAMN05421539_104143 [Jannaschia seohaensis]